MPFTFSITTSFFNIFDMLVLSLTSHGRLARATEPEDYDLILKRTIREVKFYSETMLAILLVTDIPLHISQTLACLLFTLITYIALEAMTGDSLHKCIDEIPCGRIVLACMTKLPAFAVLWTIISYALLQWHSLATKIVLGIVVFVLVAGIAAHIKVHILVKNTCAGLVGWLARACGSVIHLFRRKKDVDVYAGGKERCAGSVVSVGKDLGSESSLSGDECV